ncbi:MAG TPA: hypothetical protein VIO64_12980 [Pseudobacteroides sp.]
MNLEGKVLKLSEKDKNIIIQNKDICTDSHGFNCTVDKPHMTANE